MKPIPNGETLQKVIREALASVAPESRDLAFDIRVPLRAQIELDSMDHLHFLIALQERLGIDIPESDYEHLQTLAELQQYIEQHGTPHGTS
ncbi:MAG: phosphopantetheine-binding protein [Steroidobacteraceae bacterium]|nr:phosphopantetheine-binding protein [Steroidobacteraceae bacterium]MDW8260375.1 phosphopantetheine-binding protein [Gammaproteobacteria bacterium]